LLVPTLVVAFATTVAGCKEEPTPVKPEPSSSAGAANPKSRLSPRSPAAPQAKVDPQVMKEYRMDVCYFGSLTLFQARDAYLGSLGKDEPSDKKIPSFGAAKSAEPAKPATSAAAKPATSAAAKPAASGAAKPAASAAAGAAASAKAAGRMPPAMADRDMRRPFDISMRAPHERNARACTVAAGHKDPAMPDVDPAVQAFAPFAVELAKTIAAAQTYYQREEYKKDSFAKGKEFHKKLVEDFGKLEGLSDKLGAAIDKWRKEHPVDAAKLEGGEKLAQAAADDARGVMLAVVAEKFDGAAFKAAIEKLGKSSEELKTFGTSNATDPWPKIMSPAVEAFLKAAKEAAEKSSDKGLENETFLQSITTFTALVEAKQRALNRALIAKGQTTTPAGSGAPEAPPSPHGNPPPGH
jgi:hypothetical protein